MVSKINATPLVALEEIAARLGVAEVWLKDESKNPFGTIKDRRSKVLIDEANRFKVDKLVLITSGNNGYSLARFASGTTIKVICVVNRRLDQNVKKRLEETSYQVIEHNLEHKILRPEETISFARETEDEVIWDVTNGYEEAYSEVLAEILKALPDADYIVVPLGSGGIYMGFVQALEKSKSKARIIGIGTQNTSWSIADKLATPWTPYSKALNYHNQNGHSIFRLGEDVIKQTFMNYQHVTETEPSSAIVFGVFSLMHFPPRSKIVLVNSGKSILG